MITELHARYPVIPLETLRTWRKNVLKDPFWRPGFYYNKRNSKFTPEQEEDFGAELQEHQIDVGAYCPVILIQQLALEYARVHNIYDGDVHFRASRKWVTGFLIRRRIAHLKRRPDDNPTARATFALAVREAIEETHPQLVLNMDETGWNPFRGAVRTLANKGQDGVSVDVPCDTKAQITMIATISAAGEKLPLIALAKGTTHVCVDNLKNAIGPLDPPVIVDRSPSGWVTEDVAIRYLTWLAEWAEENDRQGLTLVWDSFSAHCTEAVKQTAEELGIRLLTVPAGQTDRCQPLDVRIFGQVKGSAKARFHRDWFQNGLPGKVLQSSVRHMADAWQGLTEDNVMDAWNHLSDCIAA